MATLGITSPSKLVAASNPIIYKVETTTIGEDTYYKARLAFTGTTLNNYIASLLTNWPTIYSQNFVARDYPNKDWYFFTNVIKDQFGAVKQSGITNTQRAGSFAECLQRDTFFNQNYYINYDQENVYLVAKQPGSRFKIDVFTKSPSNDFVNSGITKTVMVSGSSEYEGQTIDGYKLWVDVYTNPNAEFGDTLDFNDFNRVAEIMKDFQADNNNQYNIETIAKSFLQTSKPDFTSSHELYTGYMQPFFVRWGEQYPLYDYSNVTRKFQRGASTASWALNASLDFEEANNLNSYSGTTSGTTISNVKFLTNSPIIKRNTRQQNELLYILIPKNIGKDLYLKGNITFWDGTTMSNALTGNTSIVESTGNTGGAYKLNVSFDHLGLNTIEENEDKKVKKLVLQAYQLPVYDEELINGEFTSNINNWFNVTGALQSNFAWNSGNGGSAAATLGSNTQTVRFAQSGLTLTNHDHTLSYYISQTNGFNNSFTLRCLDVSNNVLLTQTLESGMSGPTTRTGSYTIDNTIASATTRIDFRFNTSTVTSHNVHINTVSLKRAAESEVPYSESKTFLYEKSDPVNRFGVSFLNKLGTYDCFDFQGLAEESVDRTKKEITYPVQINDDGSFPEGFKSSAHYDIQLTKRIVVNSGFVNEDTFNWLQELLQSTDIYSYTDEYENFLKVDGYKYNKNNAGTEYNLEVTFVQTLFKNSVGV